jgi:uncharacterized protein involved in cysteine biosynthesis
VTGAASMSFQDVRIVVDLMIGMMITEVLLKPVAIKYGKQFLGWVDQLIQVIPDWLHQD